LVALAFNMDEANYLVVLAHGSSLRALSDAAGEHFEGLGVAARLLRKRKLLSNKLAKKLVRLDECAAILRHITKASCSALAHSIQEELAMVLLPGADEAGLEGSVFGDSVHDYSDQFTQWSPTDLRTIQHHRQCGPSPGAHLLEAPRLDVGVIDAHVDIVAELSSPTAAVTPGFADEVAPLVSTVALGATSQHTDVKSGFVKSWDSAAGWGLIVPDGGGGDVIVQRLALRDGSDLKPLALVTYVLGFEQGQFIASTCIGAVGGPNAMADLPAQPMRRNLQLQQQQYAAEYGST
jgi:cold shock CspA family protein